MKLFVHYDCGCVSFCGGVSNVDMCRWFLVVLVWLQVMWRDYCWLIVTKKCGSSVVGSSIMKIFVWWGVTWDLGVVENNMVRILDW